MKNNKPILLVEDNRIDVMTVKRALRDVSINNPLCIAENGEEALEYLKDGNNARPCVILLDLNMPRMNGLEFLVEAKKDQKLKIIPVVVLTTSNEERDKMESYNLGAAGYIVKPVEYEHFREKIKTIYSYWEACEMP